MENRTKETKKFGRRYPWAKWFRRKQFVLRRGIDYDCRTAAMAQLVYQASVTVRHNVLVEVVRAEDEQSLAVRVLGPRNGTDRRFRWKGNS